MITRRQPSDVQEQESEFLTHTESNEFLAEVEQVMKMVDEEVETGLLDVISH